MKQLSTLRLFAILVLFVPLFGKAQMSGAYTIDSASATAGTNYQTFTAAITALTTNGVNGAVTFSVAQGTYTEQISIPNITGASSSNTITFKGKGDITTITAAPTTANMPVVNLDSASHVIIDSLKIEVTGSQGWGVHFMNQSDTITIKSCHIVVPVLSTCYGILGSGSITSTSVVSINAEFISIINNKIEGGQTGVQIIGMTGPLTVPNKQINYGTDLTVSGNEIIDFRGKGIILNNNHNINILNNVISSSSSVSNGAISLWDAGDNITLTGNEIYVSSNASNTRVVAFSMAAANGPAGDVTKPSLVANNFIQYAGSNSTAPTGLLLKNKAYIKVYNNTIKVKNQGGAANCVWLDNNNARSLFGIELKNNIMVLENSGSGQFIYSGSSTIAGRFKSLVIDHNNYHAPAGYFSNKVPNGTGLSTFSTFAAYKANTFGYATGALNVDPLFLSATDLHATSAAMNDSAIVIASITVDIDGETRSLTMPDIGADEYTPPTCLATTGLGSFNVTATAAGIYWTQSNSGSTFKVEYDTTGFTLGMGNKMSATNDTVSISGLMAQGTYDVYVKEICSATDSSTWTGPLTITTPCATISSFPYTETFDGPNWTSGTGSTNAGDIIDDCWNKWPATGTTFRWGTRTGSTGSSSTGPSLGYGGSGKYMFTEGSYGSTGAKSNLTTPTFDLSSLNVPQLTFQYHMYGSTMGTMMLWAWNGSAYDTVWTKTGNQGNQWNEEIIDLSSYKGQVTHLRFHAVKGTSFYNDMAIDNVVIEEAPLCPKATAVYLDNATANSLNVNFVSGGTRFLIEVGPTGFAQSTGMIDTAFATGHTVTGLSPETVYDVYIQNDCSDSLKGYSSWSGPYTIKTLCAEETGTYFNNWDALATNTTDYCWSFMYFGTSTPYARAYKPGTTAALQPYSGDNYYRYYNSANHDNYWVSPAFTYLDSNNKQVRFRGAATYSGTKAPLLIVGTMLTATDTGSFTPLDTLNPIKDTWNEYIVLLNNVPAGHKHIVFRNATIGNYVYLAFDDLSVEYLPACLSPSSGSFSNTTDISTVLSWTAGGGSTYEIEYGTAGFTQGTGMTKMGLTSTTDTITGLTAQTCYDFYIRDNCSSNNSPWYGPVTICTECAVVMAPYVENFDSANWVSGTGSTNLIDECWTRTPSTNSTFRWDTRVGATTSSSTGPSSDLSGTGKYVYTEASYSGSNANLLTPVVDFSGLTQPTLSFSYHMYGATIGNLYVTIWDSIQYDTLMTVSGQQQSGSAAPWTKVYLDLTPYKASPSRIRIIGTKGGSYTGDIAIDELSIAEMPSCLLPNAFAIDSVHAAYADFTWSTITNNTNFVLEYGQTGFVQGSGNSTKVNATGMSGALTGLSVNTTYDVYLADACDTNAWVGPLTFTTLINEDAQVLSIVSPVAGSCGDSSYVVEVLVQNNGLNTINSLPVNVNFTGTSVASVNTTYSAAIAPGATANVVVGTINTYYGGLVNVSANTALAGDQNTMNDTLVVSSIELISAVPLHLPEDTICVNDTTGIFVAIPNTGITHNWYANALDTVPMSTGDTIGAMAGQTLYLDRSKEGSFQINNQTTGSLYGSMMKLYIKQNTHFNGFSFKTKTSGVAEGIAFYRVGTYKGHETTQSSWTLIDSYNYPSSSAGTVHTLNFTNPVLFTAGDTVSIYLANTKPTKIMSQGLTGVYVDGPFYSSAEFDMFGPTGGAYFGANMIKGPTATASGNYVEMFWSSTDVCGNNRVPLTMGVNTDTAMASFVHSIAANGADVTFDASLSQGHTFDWTFDDGSTGTGMNIVHTYANGGTYNVQLVVTDTVCGTMDSITVVVNPTVSIKESMLSRSLVVFPNPNNGTFRVGFSVEGVKSVKLTLVNAMGQRVYEENLGAVAGKVEKDLNVSGLASGMYMLQVESNGVTSFVKVNIH